MALKLMTKPLVASLKERLKADPSKLHRAAPPTAQQIASIHRLAPKAPAEEPAEPMAKKKQQKLFDADYKAKIVARALKAKETGEESISAIAREENIWDANIHNWIKAAKKANGATEPTEAKPKRKGSDLRGADLNALSRELSQAMDRVAAIKKRMRKLLETD